MMLTNILPFALLAASVIASPLSSYDTPLAERQLAERQLLDNTIEDVINEVVASTNSLTAAVQAFNGSLDLAPPIVTASTALLNTISTGTTTISDAQSLDLLGVLGILPSVIALNTAVEGASGALVEKKPDFDSLGLSSIVLGQLQSQQTAAQGLVNTLLTKLPAYLPSALGEILSSPSLEALAYAISVYTPSSS